MHDGVILSHRLMATAVSLASTPPMGTDPVRVLLDLADGDRVATALALSYAFRRAGGAPDDTRYTVAIRLLARTLDGLRSVAS